MISMRFSLVSFVLLLANGGQSSPADPVTSAYIQCSSQESNLVVQYNRDLDACPEDGKRCCPCDNETILFADDFGDEELQSTKWPSIYSGRIVQDPLNADNGVLGFSSCKWGGDTFSVPFSSNTEYYRVDFDYYMTSAARVENSDSGWMGFSVGLPGSHTWIVTGYQPYSHSFKVAGSTDGKWKHYSFLYRVQLPGYNWLKNPSHLRVMLEETGRSGSTCGHALFDNVVIREAKVCSKGVLFYDDFENGTLSPQLWPKIKSGAVTDDSCGGGKILSFGGCQSGGDVYSATFSCSTGYYRVTFDYKQTVAADSPYNDGGFVAIANGLPGDHTWFFGSNPDFPDVRHNLVYTGDQWRRYSRIVQVTPGSYRFTYGGSGSSDVLRLIVEQFGNKNCGTVFFDNILVECVAFGCDCL